MSRENYRQSRKKQQLRRPRELNEKSEIALWFLESYGLKLSFLTVQEVAINEMHSLEFDQPSANDGHQENLEIFARQNFVPVMSFTMSCLFSMRVYQGLI